MIPSDTSRFKKPKLRFYLSWICAAVIVTIAKTSTIGFLTGIPVIVCGELLRIWAQGCIEKRTKLAVWGPYAFTRNPLYVGNFLIGLGFVLILSNLWILIAYNVGFFFLYRHLIGAEEKYLSSVYGAQFQEYCDQVPRFFPGFKRFHSNSPEFFTWQRLQKTSEPITLSGILLILASLYLRQIWLQEGAGLFSRQMEFFYLWLFLAVMLVFFLLQRRFKS